MKRAAVFCIAAFLTSTLQAGAVTVTERVVSGKTEPVFVSQRWDGGCKPLPATYVMTEKPKHGIVSARIQTKVIQKVITGGRQCIGKSIKSTVLFYKSVRGYVGKDRFVYRVKECGCSIVVNVVVH